MEQGARACKPLGGHCLREPRPPRHRAALVGEVVLPVESVAASNGTSEQRRGNPSRGVRPPLRNVLVQRREAQQRLEPVPKPGVVPKHNTPVAHIVHAERAAHADDRSADSLRLREPPVRRTQLHDCAVPGGAVGRDSEVRLRRNTHPVHELVSAVDADGERARRGRPNACDEPCPDVARTNERHPQHWIHLQEDRRGRSQRRPGLVGARRAQVPHAELEGAVGRRARRDNPASPCVQPDRLAGQGGHDAAAKERRLPVAAPLRPT